ncbi:MAG TPA: hypothetical protein PKW95_21355 [bacterium]|nr:hypothetical protein [bacterium]
MKKVMILVLALAMLFVVTGCFKHTFTVGKGGDGGKMVYEKWHSHWLFGIIGDENVNVKKLCPSGNATIHEEITFVNGLIGAFVGLVYYPTSVEIECAGGGRAEIELNADQVAQIVSDPDFLYFVEDVAPEKMADAQTATANAQSYLAE